MTNRQMTAGAAAVLAVLALSVAAPAGETDWDLYMLQLINRARSDPAGEAGRIGSSVIDTRAPVPPLAYHGLLDDAAENHNDWMFANLNNMLSPVTAPPYSFTHFETENGDLPVASGGTGQPYTNSSGYTGARVGERLDTVGYGYSSWAENLAAAAANGSIPIDQARMDAIHKGLWESTTGHRDNILHDSVAAFGQHVETQLINPGDGGMNPTVTHLQFATHKFARPDFADPLTYLSGILYDDLDDSGAWTPRDTGDPLREGLAGITFHVFPDGEGSAVASGQTLDNGAFAANVDTGLYELVFTDAMLPGGILVIDGVSMTDENVDLGTLLVPEPATLVLGLLLAAGALARRSPARPH
jgi:hypothetical protein